MSFPSFSEDIFSTNRALTDVEGEQIAHLLADYDNKIALLTKKIADLDAERAVLQSAATPLRQALSPFRRLPYDVIREIFIACLDPTRNPTMSCREAPVLLTRISSGTRSVALHTPELWAAIHIPIIRHSKGNKPHRKAARVSIMSARARGVEEWLLRRSGAMPLSISVHELPHPYLNQLLWSNPLADKILMILLKCCARWRDVSFAMLSTSQCQLASVKPEQVPLIRSITIRSQFPRPSIETSCWLLSSLLAAPTLRKFDNGLLQPVFQGKIYDLKVEWANITHLSLGGMFWCTPPWPLDVYLRFATALTRILRDATRLINLQVEVCRFETLPLRDEISLPFLKSLVITEHGAPSEHPGLMSYMRAHALESLTYTSIDAPSEIDIPESLRTFMHHSPGVKELSLTMSKSDYFSPQAYRKFLLSCPLLQSFRIGHADHLAGNTLLKEFVLDDIEMCLCPELEFFYCAAVLHVTPKVLYDCVLRKKGDVPHLKRWKALDLRVSVIPFIGPAFDTTELLQLSAGLDVSIKVEKMPPVKCPLDQGLPEAENERT